ncbi:NAM7-nonsense-mediated mRNA decay [Fusarium beomiforme]|uniref:NAM7-nonsense-mediated mRNA decay n=1 Tax=Fusarium beomiforme TaxID=44412 RepID=A0A9P5AG12_9HYPO|nr:NAM7-nonsense-mediated mRNA decay [Fusarium beomiforme]
MENQYKAFEDQSTTEIITQHVKHKTDLPFSESVPWHMASEFPHTSELMSIDPAPLPQHPAHREIPEHEAKNAYLEFQYLTNRFEGTEILRQAINCFRNKPTMMEGDRDDNFYIYTQVHVQGYLFAKSGPPCRISFSTERSSTKVDWRQSSRLTAGTLVVLSPRDDNFNTTCYVAVVAARYLLGGLEPNPEDNEDENTPPRIEIFWADPGTAIFDPSIEMVMLEPKGGYFETVRHAMVGLQHAAKSDNKFDKYIIHGSNKEHTAAYLEDTPGQTPFIPERANLFDSSQKEAFDRMTHRELAVIQGPPGTGKTFTSVVALESFVQTLKSLQYTHKAVAPIIVAAQTNHALDQLLDRCSIFGAIFVRLGGRTEDEAIEERSLYNLKSNSKILRGAIRGETGRKKALKRIEKLLADCFPAFLIPAEEFLQEGLISEDQYESLDDDQWESAALVSGDDGTEIESPIAHWLQGCVEQDNTYVYRPPVNQIDAHANNETPIDESKQENDRERLHGEFFPMKFYVNGTLPGALKKQAGWFHQARRLLKQHRDLYKIKPQQRGMVYRFLRHELVRARAEKFPQLLKEYQEACDDVKIGKWENDIKVIKGENIEILGCTTTGLTKYRGLIAALKPNILMIEEAAETREANISSALYPSLDQIVLVGDHQQLVPSVDVRELGREPYNMHVSLFERLVKLNLPYSMLRCQRRMVPAIREVVNAFYPKLTDHASVYEPRNRPPVPGMGGKTIWWFQHEGLEMQSANDFSFSNPDEADMIVGFVRYLVQNGVDSERITMLTFYKSQVSLLFEKLRRDAILEIRNPLKKWSVRTVDGFQGEENDIVLLSLVRSNRPGFISNENRAVVALSRAKCGMYIFGNYECLVRDENTEAYSTWNKVLEVFESGKVVDNYLPVTCHNHGKRTNIHSANGWQHIAGGGCDKACEYTCAEGHPCRITCHKFAQSEVKCLEKCQKLLRCGHQCESLCWQPCECPQNCHDPPEVKLALRTSGPPVAASRPPKGPRGGGFQATRGSKAGRGMPAHRSRSRHDGATRGSSQDSSSSRDLDARQRRLEPTSEEIMEGGYYAHKFQQTQAAVITTQTTTRSESEKWSPVKVAKKDEELRKHAKAKRSQDPVPQIVHESFQQTTTNANGERRYGGIYRSTYTIQPVIRDKTSYTNTGVETLVDDEEEDLISFD